MSQKTEPDSVVVLPRAEWKAFTDDVRMLIRADEELSRAYNRLLKTYDQVFQAYSQLTQGGAGRGKRSGLRGLFRRRQPEPEPQMVSRPQVTRPQPTGISMRMCSYCGADLDPNDKFCRTCGKASPARRSDSRSVTPPVRHLW